MATEPREEPQETTVYRTKAEKATRLSALGLTEKELQDALSYGIAEAARCTENDPRTARGWIRWAKTIRALRETLTSKGWERQERRNYPTVESADGTVAVSASSGNENVGTEQDPQTTRPKGEATKRAVIKNQTSFRDIDPNFPPDPEDLVTPDQTWLLLYHEDEEAGEARLELSLAVSMEADGYVSKWKERIILDPISTSPGPTATDEEDEPIDVPVQRRRAN